MTQANLNAFFGADLATADRDIFDRIGRELDRQQNQIELIASENIVSKAVLQAQGSILTNKYAEGYPGKRYYGGCEYVDEIETIAIERAKQLFGAGFANVQPHSGSQANQSVFMALLQPGDTFLGMDLAAGGHLTHGSPANQSGKWFKPISYTVRQQDQLIDYDGVAEIAQREKPKLIIAGGSAYSREIDFARFRQIADSIGDLSDGRHGPLRRPGGGRRTLRGPRGGMVLTNDEAIIKKVNSAVFPGLQGGPLEHVIAAKAVAFGEALQPSFKAYAQQIIANAKALSEALLKSGVNIVSGGTDSHLMLVDLRPKGVTGRDAEHSLERAHMTCNKNGVPFDTAPFTITSGIRLGTPAGTTRGFKEAEFARVGELIGEVVNGLAANGPDGNAEVEAKVRQEVLALTARFPIYN
ncbi:Serine hydroxymethyltransferase [Aphelenchoides fujianensis]|nr:Serine hydroxymethyltransferase [Aphelenchoides fujianensis]